jgi:hypothetical protein
VNVTEDTVVRKLVEMKTYLKDRIGTLEKEATILKEALRLLEGVAGKPSPPPAPIPQKREAENIRALFPQEVQAQVSIEETMDGFHAKIPYGILDKKQFASVTRLVESMGGGWISAGKDSYWKIPKAG